MFSKLVASESGQSQFRRPAVIIGSVTAHVALLAGIVWASSPEAEAPTSELQPEEEVTFIDITELPPPPEAVFEEPVAAEPEPAPQPAQRAPRPAQPRRSAVAPASTPEKPAGFQELKVPPSVVGIPPADPSVAPIRAEDFGGRGAVGGTAGGTPSTATGTATTGPPATTGTGTGTGTGSPTGTFSANMVDRAASLTNRADVVRLLQRLYPRTLSEARMEGVVQVQFVVTAQGRVDMSTVEVISASHDLFREATMQVLREFRFRPARKGEHNVRMLTTIPVQWKLER